MMYQKVKNIFWRLPRKLQLPILRVVRPEMGDDLLSLRDAEEGEEIIRKFDKHQCIFVHIPKTAGIAVKKSLFGMRGGTHRRLRNYKILFGEKEFTEYFKFTFVRNPWDRVVSAYEYLREGGMNESDRRWSENVLAQFDGFERFITEWLAETGGYGQIHFMPQYEFICLDGTEPRVDYIGRFEQINEDFNVICRELGIDASLSSENESKRRSDYKKYYNQRTRQIVKDMYSEDIDLFSYKF